MVLMLLHTLYNAPLRYQTLTNSSHGRSLVGRYEESVVVNVAHFPLFWGTHKFSDLQWITSVSSG